MFTRGFSIKGIVGLVDHIQVRYFLLIALMVSAIGLANSVFADGLPTPFDKIQETFDTLSAGVQPQQSADGAAYDACMSTVPAFPSLNGEYSQYEGKTISSVRFQSLSIFDATNPKENNAFYRALDQWHINTLPAVVNAQLLFQAGDTLSAEIIAESERLLRSRSYLGNAHIQVDQECGDRVALLVVTRDIWTTEPEFSVGREGGENQHGFGLKEGNIAGTGSVFQVNYYKNADRSGIDYGFYSPHIFKTRLAVSFVFSETSDGQQSYVSLQRPFYSLKTPWSAGVSNTDVTVTHSIRYADQEINAYKHQSEYREVFSGLAIKSDVERAQRLSVGLSYDEQNFSSLYADATSTPDDHLYTYPWLQYHYLENKYGVYKNLNLLHQTEDVSLGADIQIRLGYAGSLFDNTNDMIRYHAQYQDLLGLGAHHLVRMSLSLDGRAHPSHSELDEAVWGGELGYFYLMGDKHRWYSSLSYFQGYQLLQHRELTAGGETGLRGYPIDYQRGDQRYLFTLEKRYVSDLHIFNLIRLGGVIYVDAGKAWGGGYPPTHNLLNVGVGLRLSSSKARVGNVLHVDLAFPMVDKEQVDSFQFVIKASRSM